MKIALVSSRADPGGSTIHDALFSLLETPHDPYPLEKHELYHHRSEDRLIYQDCIDREFNADLVIFLSRHSSKNPIPVLTVHATGNFGPAAFGGREGSLAPTAPAWMHAVLRGLATNAPPGYRVAYEVTHHGPTELETPSFFVEVGSTEREWKDAEAASAVARSVLSAIPGDSIPLVGFGGTHYAARQTHISLSSRGAFGHIAHTRDIPRLDRALLAQMVEESGAVAAYIDRKSIPAKEYRNWRVSSPGRYPDRPRNDLLRMGELSWDSYQRVLQLAEETAPGGTVTFHGTWPDGDPEPIDIPSDLLEEALRCDAQGFVGGLENIPVVRIATEKNLFCLDLLQ